LEKRAVTQCNLTINVEQSKKGVSRDRLAMLFGNDDLGRFAPTSYDEVAEDILASLSGIFPKIANQYKFSFPYDEVEDLVSETQTKFISSLSKYDCSKGSKITTWAWRVSSNYLDTRYRKQNGKRKADVVFGEEDVFTAVKDNSFCVPFNYGVVTNDMVECVRKILSKYPERRDLIISVLFNPDDKNPIIPQVVDLQQISEDFGFSVDSVEFLINEAIKPIMARYFKGN